jgi:hypothetical protein
MNEKMKKSLDMFEKYIKENPDTIKRFEEKYKNMSFSSPTINEFIESDNQVEKMIEEGIKSGKYIVTEGKDENGNTISLITKRT